MGNKLCDSAYKKQTYKTRREDNIRNTCTQNTKADTRHYALLIDNCLLIAVTCVALERGDRPTARTKALQPDTYTDSVVSMVTVNSLFGSIVYGYH